MRDENESVFDLFVGFGNQDGKEALRVVFTTYLVAGDASRSLKTIIDAVRSCRRQFKDGYAISTVARSVLTEVVQSSSPAGDKACKELCEFFTRSSADLRTAVDLLPAQHFLAVLRDTGPTIEYDSVLRDMILPRLREFRTYPGVLGDLVEQLYVAIEKKYKNVVAMILRAVSDLRDPLLYPSFAMALVHGYHQKDIWKEREIFDLMAIPAIKEELMKLMANEDLKFKERRRAAFLLGGCVVDPNVLSFLMRAAREPSEVQPEAIKALRNAQAVRGVYEILCELMDHESRVVAKAALETVRPDLID